MMKIIGGLAAYITAAIRALVALLKGSSIKIEQAVEGPGCLCRNLLTLPRISDFRKTRFFPARYHFCK